MLLNDLSMWQKKLSWFNPQLSYIRKKGNYIWGPAVHAAVGCGQISLSYSVAVPPAPVRVSSKMQLAPSVTSVTPYADAKGGAN